MLFLPFFVSLQTRFETDMHFSNRQILKITFPVLLSLMMEQLIGLTDTIYLGHVGEVELGASAIAGILYLTIFMVGFGFSIGAQVLIARRNGEGDLAGIGPIFTQSLWFLLALAVFVFLLSQLLAPRLLDVWIESPAIASAAGEYLRYRTFGFFFSFAAALFRAFYVGTTHTRILTANSVVMVLTNVALNYLLIFGGWGIPPLGIAGAAIASSISEAVSLVFFVIYTLRRVEWRRYGLFRFGGFDLRILKHVFSVSVWIMLQEACAFISWFIFFVAVEHLGERPLAVTNMVRSVSSIVFLFVNAFASTASSLAGNLIGAGDPDEVPGLCRRMVRLCFAFVLPVSLFFALFPRLVLGAYTGNEELITAAVPSLWVMLTTMIPCVPAFVYLFCVSGTGNTRMSLVIVLASVTGYTLYTLWLVFGIRADVALCWTTDHLYYLISLVLSYIYIRSGRWRRLRI